MPRCTHCRKGSHLQLTCKWCTNHYCTSCLQNEIHKCTGYEKMRDAYTTSLANKLMSEQVVGAKMTTI